MGAPISSSRDAHPAPLHRSIPPAVKIALLYAAGIVLAQALSPSLATLAWVSVVLAGMGLGLWHSRRASTISQFVLAGGILAVSGLQTRLAHQPAPNDIYHHARGERLVVEGEICRYPEERGDRTYLHLSRLRVRVDEGWQPAHGKVRLRVSGFTPTARYGDRIRADGRLRRPRPARNPGEFDYRRYLLAQDISATLAVYRPERLEVVQTGGGWWLLRDAVYPLKSWIAGTVRERVGGTEAELVQSLVIGERGGLPDDVREGFARSGVIHVLAVSGLHVGFVILVSLALLTLFRLPRPLHTPLTLLILLLYVYLTNERPSVVRASVMGGLLLVARDLQRRTPVTNTLALAALVILVIQPLSLFQPSFQLSFAAVLGIVYLYPPLDQALARGPFLRIKRHAAGRFVVGLFVVSLAAQLGTLPLAAWYFGRIPLVALLANLLVIPLVFLIVGFAATALILTPISHFLAGLYWEAASFSASTVIKVVEISSRFPLAALDYPRPELLHAGLFVALLLLLLGRGRRRARLLSLGTVLLTLNVVVWRGALQAPRLEVIFFDVGQGDAALVTTPNGKTLLIDAGDRWERSDAGERTIAPYLRRRDIRRLDAVVFTHAHEDHYGGLPSLLRRFEVGVVYAPDQENGAESFRALLHLVDSLRVPFRHLGRGQRIGGFEPLRLFVVHPTDRFTSRAGDDSGGNLNDGSVVIKLQYGDQSILFTGDAERAAEEQFVGYGRFLRSQVLKVGHHGSRTSTGADLVEAVAPRLAIVSVGEINSYGLPDEKPLDRLARVGAKVLRTDKVGAVVVRSDGRRTWRVR